MEKAPEVEILAREAIKPSYPTPHHLREFKLSLLDQIAPSQYESQLFFYAGNNEDSSHNVKPANQISQRLKSSLSETLTKFYPFAGKFKDEFSIECNDEGAEYVEARTSCFLSEFLQKPDQKLLRKFLPIELESSKASTGPILLVQATFFTCGGFVLGFCFSHRFIDALTFLIFIDSWAAATREAIQLPRAANYVIASIFPPSESFVAFPKDHSQPGCVTKRFVFDASKLAVLKTKVASASVPRPSRTEAVTALIWKSAIAASRSRSNNGCIPFPRPSLLVNAVNLRRVVEPRLPDNSVGNAVGYFSAQISEKEIQLQDLVCVLRKQKEEFSKNGLHSLLETKHLYGLSELIRDKIERDEFDFYFFSSVNGFPFYQVDFRWGKPIWVTFPNYTIRNFILILGTEDGKGIEAVVTLGLEDMALFERDQELLSFAALNPSVLHLEAKVPKKLPSLL